MSEPSTGRERTNHLYSQFLLQEIANAEALIARNNVAIAEHEAYGARIEAEAAKIEAAIAINEEFIARRQAGAK
jgi:hypothetical protein